jgi:hypothetical protein
VLTEQQLPQSALQPLLQQEDEDEPHPTATQTL